MYAFDDRTQEEEHAGNENSLKLLDDRDIINMRETPWWVTDEHKREFRCDACGGPMGFSESHGIGGKLYHQPCGWKLSTKG